LYKTQVRELKEEKEELEKKLEDEEVNISVLKDERYVCYITNFDMNRCSSSNTTPKILLSNKIVSQTINLLP